MSGMPAEERKGYTWDDYRAWQDDKRWEIIGGEAFDMTPAPALAHQAISRELECRLVTFFAGKASQVFQAPTDVKLSEEDIVQPDIVVVCNRDQMRETHIEGPPRLVIEILSPGSLRHDRVRKMELYARFGVQEFWLVTPEPALVEVFVLDKTSYRLHGGYGPDETVRSAAFPKLRLSLVGVFAFAGGSSTGQIRKVKEPAVPYGRRAGSRSRGPARYRQP
jgi:Uma2 family endonuclease